MAGLDTRTTSLVEAINSQIQRTFPAQPSILQYVEFLKMHESMSSTDLYHLVQEKTPDKEYLRKRPTDRARDKKIKHFSALFGAGDISIGDFLVAMSLKEISNVIELRKSKTAQSQLKTISVCSKNLKK